jgi:anthranilate phosphoribosyltransferase
MRALQLLSEKKSLSEEESFEAFSQAIHNPAQLGALLALLKAKGESVDEILGLLKAMRKEMIPVAVDRPVLDIVGTGGDMAHTYNISTGSALLAARCGIPVIKHGNRSVSSQCGSADVLEAMGYPIHQTPEEVKQNLEDKGFGFCFAPDYHPMLATVKAVRTALKIPTIFNIIGPLLNPAGASHLQIGVYQKEKVPLLAEVLFRLKTKRSIVYSGHGIDELSCIGPTEALLVTEQGIEPFLIDPEKLGLRPCTLQDLKGGDACRNAKALQNPPKGLRDTLILNAAVALFLYGAVTTLEEGVKVARGKIKTSLKEAIVNCPKAIISEIKRASPSKGAIADIPDPAQRANYFEESGAAAISVLTSDRFSGTVADLKKVKQAVAIPVLRKDFITSVEMLNETDADAVLLIVSYLKGRTKEMLEAARHLGVEAIVEVHSEEELKIALEAGAEIIGVNQRNLSDFTMHPEVYRLIDQIPDSVVAIAESGVKNIEDAKRLFAMGYDALLVGEALSRCPQLCEELCSLKSAE